MALLSVFIAASCTQQIDLELDSAVAHLVIEANISDQAPPYFVRLTNSLPYYETGSFPTVSSALVIISDDAGNTDTLTETTPGLYQTDSAFQGTVGRTYTLKVAAGGKEYNAISYLPHPVSLDTIWVQSVSLFRNARTSILTRFQDPANEHNYYRLVLSQTTTTSTAGQVVDDHFFNGTIQATIFGDGEIKTGDTITVNLQCIDKGVYDYYNSFESNTGGQNQTAAPANPTSNITNGALGYFSAYSATFKTIVVP